MTLRYRRDRNMFRVWQSSWHGDAFEVLNADEFAGLVRICRRFGFALLEAEDD